MLGLGILSQYAVTLDFPRRKMYLRRGLRFGAPDRRDLSGLHLLLVNRQVVIDSVDVDSEAERRGLKAADNVPGTAEWLFTIRERLSQPSPDLVIVCQREGRIEITALELSDDGTDRTER